MMMVPPEERRIPFWSGLDALLFFTPLAVLFVVPAAMVKPGVTVRPSMAGLWLEYAVFAVWFLALAAYLRRRYDAPFWESMAWRIPWKGVLGTAAAGPLLAVSVALLGNALGAEQLDPLRDMVTDAASAVLLGVFAVVIGPVVEELMFRGFLLPLTVKWAGPVLGILLCATPFALLHGPQYQWSWQHLVLLVGASSVFGWARLQTGSTAAAALLHAGYNLVFYAGYLIQRKDPLS